MSSPTSLSEILRNVNHDSALDLTTMPTTAWMLQGIERLVPGLQGDQRQKYAVCCAKTAVYYFVLPYLAQGCSFFHAAAAAFHSWVYLSGITEKKKEHGEAVKHHMTAALFDALTVSLFSNRLPAVVFSLFAALFPEVLGGFGTALETPISASQEWVAQQLPAGWTKRMEKLVKADMQVLKGAEDAD